MLHFLIILAFQSIALHHVHIRSFAFDSLGIDASESGSGVNEEVPEDVIEPDQQEHQGKQLSPDP